MREKTENEKLVCNECDEKVVSRVTTSEGVTKYFSIDSTYIVTDSFTLEKDRGRGGHILLCEGCYNFFYRGSVEDVDAYRHESRRLLKKYRNRDEIDFDLVG
jgi:hypothetical protein